MPNVKEIEAEEELLIAEIEKEEALLAVEREKLERLKESEPFYFWKPNDGKITKEKRELLLRWLKEEDVPERTDSQLDVLLSKSSIKGISGGNRSSKTDVATVRGVILSIGELPLSLEGYKEEFKEIIERAHGREVVSGRVTGVDNKQLHRVVIPMWQKYVPRKYLKGGDWDKSYSKEFDILTLYRGGKKCAQVEYLTNEQKVKSAQGNVLHWAGFDEEPEQAKYKETLMRFGTAKDLDIMIAWTPTEGLTWATDLFQYDVVDGEEDGTEKNLFKLTPVTNPFVNPETLIKIMDEYARVSSYDEMKMRLLGEAISLTGLVYSGLFFKSIHVIEPFTLTKDYMVIRGLDPHTVKPTVCVEVAVDRMGYEYVCGVYSKAADTEILKADLAERAKEMRYRLAWTRCDMSADSTIKALGDRNIYRELGRGKNAVPALDKSQKAVGSIHAGVDEIKKLLKINEITKKPKLFIFNIPENQILIKAFQTLEREAYANEDKKGLKDRIAEGKHDAHAALRYIHQKKVRWVAPVTRVPVYQRDGGNVAY